MTSYILRDDTASREALTDSINNLNSLLQSVDYPESRVKVELKIIDGRVVINFKELEIQ